MKTILKLNMVFVLTLSTLYLCLSGCNSNNGDIGPWYGQWKLTKMLIDGSDDTQYQGNIFWAFQNSVVQMTEIKSDLDYNSRWGSWAQEGDELILDFSHHDNQSMDDPTTAWRYAPPAETHLETGVNKLTIVKLSDSNIELTYNSPDGHTYTYFLKAWE